MLPLIKQPAGRENRVHRAPFSKIIFARNTLTKTEIADRFRDRLPEDPFKRDGEGRNRPGPALTTPAMVRVRPGKFAFSREATKQESIANFSSLGRVVLLPTPADIFPARPWFEPTPGT
jgi:hypothetical protein